ncbi:MAG: FecR family protein, partial [bacterium]
SHRNLSITGEAYFDVTENKDLPFTVNVKENKLIALGTEFYVSAYDYNNRLSSGLLSGKIRIETSEETVELSKPGAASFDLESGSLISKGKPEPSHYEWKNGKLIFNNTSLEELSHRLSNWYNHTVKVEESIKDQKFTLRIEDENIKEVLELIKLASELEYKATDTGYYIFSN